MLPELVWKTTRKWFVVMKTSVIDFMFEMELMLLLETNVIGFVNVYKADSSQTQF